MEQSIGRTAEPTTQADEPDAREHTPGGQPVTRRNPPPADYEDTVLSDPSRRPSVDPLDPHKPSRETNDPLDPDGHVI
jgi:hypothetical protein